MHGIVQADSSHQRIIEEMYLAEIADDTAAASKFSNDLIHRFTTILCFSEDSLCGTLSWEVRGGLADGVIELVAMGTMKKYQRQGVGTALVSQMLDDARTLFLYTGHRLRIIYLFMERGNETARIFYESLGFEEKAVLNRFYPEEDASIMILRIY